MDTDVIKAVRNLERQVRTLRVSLAVIVAGGVIFSLVGAIQSGSTDPVQATEFRLIDDSGQLRARLGNSVYGPQFEFLSPEGTRSLGLRHLEGVGPSLTMDDPGGGYFEFSATGIQARDSLGIPRLSLGVADGVQGIPRLWLGDAAGRPRAVLAVDEEGGGVLIFNDAVGTIRSSHSQNAVAIADLSGEIVWIERGIN
jgi:hypothetical protein